MYGSFAVGTKIYMHDKTLKNIEDLNFGDSVLSLKIKNIDIEDNFSFYNKYILHTEGNEISIPIDNAEFCTATVFSIKKIKSSPKVFKINNSIIGQNQFIAKISNLEDKEIFLAKNTTLGNTQLIAKFNIQDNVNFIPEPILKSEIIDNVPMVSIGLLDNYFYFTENLMAVSLNWGDA